MGRGGGGGREGGRGEGRERGDFMTVILISLGVCVGLWMCTFCLHVNRWNNNACYVSSFIYPS